MSVFFPKLSQSIYGEVNTNLIDTQYSLPKEIIEQILFDLLLSVPYDMLLKYLRINKYCYELYNQTAFAALRYETNPSSKEFLVEMDTNNLIRRLITGQDRDHEDYGDEALYNNNSIVISLNKKYTDIYQRFGISEENLETQYAYNESSSYFLFILQIIYHGPNKEKKFTLRFDNDCGCRIPIDSKFPDGRLYDLLYRVVFFQNIYFCGFDSMEEKFFRST